MAVVCRSLFGFIAVNSGKTIVQVTATVLATIVDFAIVVAASAAGTVADDDIKFDEHNDINNDELMIIVAAF